MEFWNEIKLKPIKEEVVSKKRDTTGKRKFASKYNRLPKDKNGHLSLTDVQKSIFLEWNRKIDKLLALCKDEGEDKNRDYIPVFTGLMELSVVYFDEAILFKSCIKTNALVDVLNRLKNIKTQFSGFRTQTGHLLELIKKHLDPNRGGEAEKGEETEDENEDEDERDDEEEGEQDEEGEEDEEDDEDYEEDDVDDTDEEEERFKIKKRKQDKNRKKEIGSKKAKKAKKQDLQCIHYYPAEDRLSEKVDLPASQIISLKEKVKDRLLTEFGEYDSVKKFTSNSGHQKLRTTCPFKDCPSGFDGVEIATHLKGRHHMWTKEYADKEQNYRHRMFELVYSFESLQKLLP
ncbi:uncharacterized protein [Clytia hemisphaerica]|uniref:uncharacterized protein n=1 Tax=Clytia hemisphaerica TaxID=252671 RepID=UPI0034D72EDB